MDSAGTSDSEWTNVRLLALEYAADDPDPITRDALRRAVRADDREGVRQALHPRLEFGTAGLRGAVGPGPARLNVLVCARFAWALGTFLSARPELARRGVLLGFDARRDSARFASTIESILGGLGIGCWTASAPLPTPVVAFGVRQLRASAGIVVTASHNPAPDNGIKLYDDEGIQIVAPWDEEIERLMQCAPRYDEMGQGESSLGSLESAVVPAYLAQLRARTRAFPPAPRLSVAYTPVHGVGLRTFEAAILGSNIALCVVPEQAEPDPEFPTTPFPNPEEPGVLDRVLALARQEQVDLVLANDPDADRLAVALPDGRGQYVKLSGDEVGLLLCDGLVDTDTGPPTCISSVVSSPALDAWAAEKGGRVVRTLTGFKWLARAAIAEDSFLLAYEEALGYCTPAPAGHLAPLDKDGIAAALDIIGCALRAGSGVALLARLAHVSTRIGVWVCHAESIRVHGAAGTLGTAQLMEALRRAPPKTLGTDVVLEVTDYLEGAEERSPWLGRQDLLALRTAGGAYILVRPSGTEPKVKIYTHLVGAASGDTPADYVRRREELLALAGQLTGSLRAHVGAS